ncbi:hypothetical protein LR48_Vigan08g073400 [Vigna angularis]|uniref:Uncharacterized protein n=1 Tax=Phaseolus angularis TaxID=3914 RepID=A0A0L9V4L8_PHAAN|nr:hypothetical protein LR48_Vigan08g073400 [Vigna angularis]
MAGDEKEEEEFGGLRGVLLVVACELSESLLLLWIVVHSALIRGQWQVLSFVSGFFGQWVLRAKRHCWVALRGVGEVYLSDLARKKRTKLRDEVGLKDCGFRIDETLTYFPNVSTICSGATPTSPSSAFVLKATTRTDD